MEPVKGFLGRFLRRRLLETEVQEGIRNNDLNRIFDWIPKVWQHLNKFLETHSSSDVTIGKFQIHLHLPLLSQSMNVAKCHIQYKPLHEVMNHNHSGIQSERIEETTW